MLAAVPRTCKELLSQREKISNEETVQGGQQKPACAKTRGCAHVTY